MEKTIAQYQQCIKTLLAKYDGLRSAGSQVELLFDDERMRYMAIWVGWWNSKRIYQCAVHIDICDDLVVIQCNDTEDLIASELVDLGIPREKIRLGFLPSEVQTEVEIERRPIRKKARSVQPVRQTTPAAQAIPA